MAGFVRCAHCGLPHDARTTTCPFTGRRVAVAASSRPPPARDALVGTTVEGRYRIEGLIGQGGMGTVYRARNLRIEKPVAIKVLRSGERSLSASVERFMREARAAASVRHANVLTIYDVGTLPDQTPFIVMELLHGESLYTRIERETQLDVSRASTIAMEALAGLEAVHRSGAIHRDVKPANIFLASGPTGETVKLLDFGLSKTAEESRLTRTGEVIGTPNYLAPEQARGMTQLDRRVDVWATGVVLYEMLTGVCPFDGSSLVQIVTRILTHAPPPASSLRAGLPGALDGVLAVALAKDPSQRYGSAEQMRAALAQAAGDAPRASAPPAPATARRAPDEDERETLRTSVPSMAATLVDADPAGRETPAQPSTRRSRDRER